MTLADLSAIAADLEAAGSLALGDVSVTTALDAKTGANLSFAEGSKVTGGAVSLRADSISGSDALTVSSLTAAATDALSLGAITASGAVSLTTTSGAMTLAGLSAAEADLEAAGDLTLGNVSVAEKLDAKAGANLAFAEGSKVTGGAVSLTAEEALALVAFEAGATTLTAGSISGSDALTVSSLTATAADDLSLGAITATGAVSLTSAAGVMTLADLSATAADLEAAGDLTLGNVSVTEKLDAKAGASLAFAAGSTVIGGAVSLRADSISGSDALIVSSLTATAVNALSVGTITATGAVSLTSTAGSVTATDALTATDQTVTISAAADAALAEVRAASVTVEAAGALELGSISAATGFDAKAGTSLAFLDGATITGGTVSLTAAEALTLPMITATGAVAAESSGGGITVNPELNVAEEVQRLLDEGTVAVPVHEGASVTAGSLLLQAAGDVFLADVAVQGDLTVQAEGALLLANGSAITQEQGTLGLTAGGDALLSNMDSQGELLEVVAGGRILGQPTVDDVGTLLRSTGHANLEAGVGIGAEDLKRIRLDASSVSAQSLGQGDLILFGVNGLNVVEPGVRSEAERGWVALITEDGKVDNRDLATALSNRVLIKEGVGTDTEGFIRGGLAAALLINGTFDQTPQTDSSVDLQSAVSNAADDALLAKPSPINAEGPRLLATLGQSDVAESALRDGAASSEALRVAAMGGLTSMLELVQLSNITPLDSRALIPEFSQPSELGEETAVPEGPAIDVEPASQEENAEEQGEGANQGGSEAGDGAEDAEPGEDGAAPADPVARLTPSSLWRGTWQRMLDWLDRQTVDGMPKTAAAWPEHLPALHELAETPAAREQGASKEAETTSDEQQHSAQVETETTV
jgi:hypothetical protein